MYIYIYIYTHTHTYIHTHQGSMYGDGLRPGARRYFSVNGGTVQTVDGGYLNGLPSGGLMVCISIYVCIYMNILSFS